jgi:hypothetical protein
VSAVRTGRRTFACRATQSMDLPEPIAFPVDHRPERRARDPHGRVAAVDLEMERGRWPHTLSHRGCGETRPRAADRGPAVDGSIETTRRT